MIPLSVRFGGRQQCGSLLITNRLLGFLRRGFGPHSARSSGTDSVKDSLGIRGLERCRKTGRRRTWTRLRLANWTPGRRSVESRDFEAGLRRKIVGQDEAVQAVVDLYQVFRAGLNSPGRPVGNLLFLGPTGAGKTRVVEATAEVLFGDPR
jgi:DNA replication protein DnaC